MRLITTKDCNCVNHGIRRSQVTNINFLNVDAAASHFQRYQRSEDKYWAVHVNGLHILNIIYGAAS